MNNPRLASRYAKSMIDLAVEQNQLEAIYSDMKGIAGICKSNPDFTAVLRSPIIKADKKGKIIEAITKGNVAAITSAFIQLLVTKGRESNLPEISESFIDQYNAINNIHKVKITTAAPMSEDVKASILARVKASYSLDKVQLETAVDESLIGGFVLETGDKLVDASILRDLKDVRKQFTNNDFIHQIR